MPRINKFRIVNFRYDNDKKFIANELFEFKGQNTLINLENGGGKSVILQLALQVLIPNAELSSRKFVDYFKVNSGTVHILIEWLLDGTTREYFLTGICAGRDSEGLRFFTYTHTYSSPNECDIKRIPVVNSKKQVTGYSEFYKYLRSMTSEYRINTYSKDRMSDYRKKLSDNSLFRDEFDAILQINQSEGGIEKFFERARKSRNVIERLIIPAIPSLGGEQQSILTDTFKKHLENLKSIPVLQYNINLYESFLERGSELLGLLTEYERSVNSTSEYKAELRILENIILVVGKRLESDMERLETELEEMKKNKSKVQYKQDSLVIFLEKRKRQELEERLKNRNRVREIEQIRLDDTTKKIKYMNAVNSCLDLREQRNKRTELKEKLQLLSMQEGEIQQDFQDCLYHLAQLLEGEIARIKDGIQKCIKESSDIRAQATLKKQQREEKQKEKETASNELAVARSNKEKAEKAYKAHAVRFNSRDMTLLLDPMASLAAFEKTLSGLEQRKKELEQQIKDLLTRQEDARIRENNANSQIETSKVQLSNKTGIWEEYERKLGELTRRIAVLGLEEDLYSGSVEAKLAAMIEKKGLDLAEAQVDCNAIENKKLLLDGLDYFLADMAILKVYKYMEERGIDCIPGSLWLKRQPEGKRAELLRKNPLLQYAIIIDESELGKVMEYSEAMAKLAEDYPVSIIAGNSRGLTYSAGTEDAVETDEGSKFRLDSIKDSQIFLLRSESSMLLINDGELEKYVSGLGQRLEKARGQVNALKCDQENIIGLKEKASEFLKEHSLSWKKALADEIGSLKQKIEGLQEEAEKLRHQQKEFANRKEACQEEYAKTEQQLEDTEKDIYEMKELINVQSDIAECQKSISRLAPVIHNLNNEISSLDKEKENLDEKRITVDDKKNELSRESQRQLKRLEEVKSELTVRTPTRAIEAGSDELEARIKGIRGKLSASDRTSISDGILLAEKYMERHGKEIKKNGHEEADFENVYERIPEQIIVEAEELEGQLKTEVKKLEKECSAIKDETTGLKARIDTLEKILFDNFAAECYEFTEGERLDAQFYEERIKELGTKIKKLEGNIASISSNKIEVEKVLDAIQRFIEDRGIEMPEGFEGDMLQLKGFEESLGLWEVSRMKAAEIAVLFKRYRTEYDRIEKATDESRKKVEDCFDSLYTNEAWREHSTIKRILSGIMKDNLYNVRHMQELFEKLFESVRRMRDADVLQQEECKRNKAELVERCLQRARTVYDEVKLVDTFSKIKISGESLKIVKIEMPKLEEEQGRASMALYIEKCIENISRQKDEGSYDPARIDNTISGYMAPHVLLDAVVSLNDISIKVYKPQHNLELSQYISWEEVVQWSGGEKLAGFFAMFISIVSYLRYKRTGWTGSTKVIWIDNPFGQANAGHILGYIFDLAKATHTQMICLTGLQETTIYSQFEVVYSLVHRMLSNMSIVQSKAVKTGQSIEAGYYNLNSEQMSIF